MTANLKQRYLCKDCRRQFITDYSYRGCMPQVRDLIVPMTMNGSGIRDIARVLQICPNTVLGVLRAQAEAVTEPTVPKRIKDLEIDEFWSFVHSKAHQRWTWYAFDRQRRQVVAFVNGRRTDQSCAQLRKKLRGSQVKTFHTDEWPSYAKYLPPRRHQVGKAGTLRIERENLNFRTHIKRLHRRTICYSKSEEMHDAVLKLYIHHANASQHQL
jgi:IS1 family transposase